MRINSTQNQKAFDQHKAREAYCTSWLKQQQKKVAKPIAYSAIFGILNGLLQIVQTALIAFLLHQLIIEKQALLFDFNSLWQLELKNLFIGLIDSYAVETPIPASYLQLAIMSLFPIFLMRSLCVYYFQVTGFEAAATVKSSLRTALHNKFPRLSAHYLKQQQTGELAQTTLEQVEALEAYFSRYCPQRLLVTCLPLLMIVIVLPVNWIVAVIFLCTAPLIIVFMALIGMGAAAANRQQFLAMARMSGYFLDRLQGLTTLKLFGQAQAELNNINQVADNFRHSTLKVLRIAFLSSAVLEFFSALAVALVAVFIGLSLLGLINFGSITEISLQQGLFLLILAPEFFMPLKQLAVNYHDRAAALSAADLILNILEAPEIKHVAHKTSAKFYIEFRNINKYYQQRHILKNINLQIKQGEKIALVGESGAGKTTLLNLLLGLETADEGDIFLNPLIKNNLSYLPQRPSIFHGSISDNISLFNAELSQQAIMQAAFYAGVTTFSDSLSEGLNTMIGEQGYGLSGGQIQRIALARIFLKNSAVILLDEPTAHLDNSHKTLLLNTIEALFKDKTVIIATHDGMVIDRMQRQFSL